MTVPASVLALSPNHAISVVRSSRCCLDPTHSAFIQGANTLDGSFAFKEMGPSGYQVNSH